MWHPNKNKHKAQHRGYKSKPSAAQVDALLGFYAMTGEVKTPQKQQPGKQLKLSF
jgi:hypothetical protein